MLPGAFPTGSRKFFAAQWGKLYRKAFLRSINLRTFALLKRKSKMEKKKILFVCLGNICRSSAAEGVMRRLVEEAGMGDRFEIDSAGILSYHRGELPDPRMRAHAARRGYRLTHRSRPVTTDDFLHFDLIIGMDARNMDDLRERAPSPEEWAKLRRMTDFALAHTDADHVPDPYYGGAEGFEYVLDLLEDACAGLLQACLTDDGTRLRSNASPD